MNSLTEIGKKSKSASSILAVTGSADKNKALLCIAGDLVKHTDVILKANERDMEAARKNGLSESMLDRLKLTPERIKAMADGVLSVAGQEDPVGQVLSGDIRPNGLEIKKIRVPLGVIAIIYEARPNVTVDAAVLCLKAGNSVILRGGSEAVHSGKCLSDLMRNSLKQSSLPEDAILFIDDTSRETVGDLMRLNGYVDVLIPRGGAGLIKAVVEGSTVPVIETGTGNCHVYIDETADLLMGADIIFNAKTSRPSVCNAAETLLVHTSVAERFLPMAKKRLDEKKVLLYGCPRTIEILGDDVLPAGEEEYNTEFLDYKLAVKVVGSMEEAIDHIARYSTKHSETIVTESYDASRIFTSRVDAAAVYVNASTRFTDGGEFGFGAEIGISTQKLHARGPMGLHELTSYKYIVLGSGQIR